MGADELRRCVFLAVDGQPTHSAALGLVEGVMAGPMAPYTVGAKWNDALHAEGWGGAKIVGDTLTKFPELRGFLDIKGADVVDTIENILKRYKNIGPERLLVTISVHSSVAVFKALAKNWPRLNVITMGVPTDIALEDFEARYGTTPAEAMKIWFRALTSQFRRDMGDNEVWPSRYVISSLDMLEMYREEFPGVRPIVPGIRDAWMLKGAQKRTAGTYDALKAGAEFLVMGSQLFKGNSDAGISAADSQARTADEIKRFIEGCIR